MGSADGRSVGRAAMFTAWFAIVACAHVTPPAFTELSTTPPDLRSRVVEALKDLGHRVAELEAQQVSTSWDHSRHDTETRRERFVVRWEGVGTGPVTLFVRHEAQSMSFAASGGSGWRASTHDRRAQNRVLDALVDRLTAPEPVLDAGPEATTTAG